MPQRKAGSRRASIAPLGRRARWLALLPLLASAPQTPTTAGRPPDDPRIFHQYAPGLLTRINVVADSGATRIAQWDLLIGPGMTSAPATLPGGAVFEVRAGQGRVTLNDKAREIRAGETFVVNEGGRFAFVNGRTDLGLALRVILLSRRTP